MLSSKAVPTFRQTSRSSTLLFFFFFFFLVEQYLQQFSTNESFIYIYYNLKISFVSISCETWIEIQPNCHREVKFEHCCKVTDNTVMVVFFTVDVNNEINLIQVFGLYIIMLSFKQYSVCSLVKQYPLFDKRAEAALCCFFFFFCFSSRAVPTAVFDKRVFYLHLL